MVVLVAAVVVLGSAVVVLDETRDCVCSMLCVAVREIVWEAVGAHSSKIRGEDRSFFAEWSSLVVTKRLHLLLHRIAQEDELRLSDGDCVMISDVSSM